MLLHLDDEQGLGFGYRRGENDRIEMQTRGSSGILWKDSHINLKGTKELELVLKARKAINLRGDYVAQHAAFAPVDAVIHPDFTEGYKPGVGIERLNAD